ncbi:MAG: bifunctional UDP-3-O-[3-hydroxymyristoyl] N-acetylglucosamine deacetylase/3-hydroxyacyl-ACP dehydratase [Bacteroidales bacterium]|jgi:UDP-3-O-[3-hydroxymyristoyl] N-acetylglucosamine deacetylase/3-hydroxyacyl-[acyl-carrier-protein] dehydratase|nr:bifunctional UDP-3-O-[3-hydroxymyristoyl] N-acetylglucosamine deacetylase/3-hydroxyacyl-ACP dehydratase [Bacteroidales bacterium]
MVKQKTIKKSFTLSGKGLHYGKYANVTLLPAKENTGIVFQRVDLENCPKIEALATNISDTSRNSSLEKNGAKVSTIEHLLSALHYFGIDNAIIEVDNEEIPIMDGSALCWVKAIEEAGVTEQNAIKKVFVVKDEVEFVSDNGKTQIKVEPFDGFKVDLSVDFHSSVLGIQEYSIDSLDDFPYEIAPARTFVFLHDLEKLLNYGLAKGGTLDNALVFVDHPLKKEQIEHLSKEFQVDSRDVVVEKGILYNKKLKFLNEPARHKLLDFIGDIFLCGFQIKGHFTLKCPGHYANTEFAKLMIKKFMMEKTQKAPIYDPNKEPVYSITDIKKFLPHRFPMLLVDKIIETGDDYVVGIKNVTGNEDFFNGHFPSEPVMPGVLIVEAMGQTGGILVLKDYPDPENYTTYFLKIDGVKFRGKVVPGDTLIFRLFLTEPVRRGLVKMKGEAYVGNKLVMEAELMAQISKVI